MNYGHVKTHSRLGFSPVRYMVVDEPLQVATEEPSNGFAQMVGDLIGYSMQVYLKRYIEYQQ